MQVDDNGVSPGLRFIWWTARFLIVTGILRYGFVIPSMIAEHADYLSSLPLRGESAKVNHVCCHSPNASQIPPVSPQLYPGRSD